MNLVELLIFTAVARYANKRLTGKLPHLIVEPNDQIVYRAALHMGVVKASPFRW